MVNRLFACDLGDFASVSWACTRCVTGFIHLGGQFLLNAALINIMNWYLKGTYHIYWGLRRQFWAWNVFFFAKLNHCWWGFFTLVKIVLGRPTVRCVPGQFIWCFQKGFGWTDGAVLLWQVLVFESAVGAGIWQLFCLKAIESSDVIRRG